MIADGVGHNRRAVGCRRRRLLLAAAVVACTAGLWSAVQSTGGPAALRAPSAALSGFPPGLQVGAGPSGESAIRLRVSYADGRPAVTFEAPVRGGTLYLSDWQLSAALGVSVKYDPLLRIITLSGRKGEAKAVVGGTAALVNGRALNLADPFLGDASELLVPVGFVAQWGPEVTGAAISWNEAAAELVLSGSEPDVSTVTFGGRPGLARVTVATTRPLAYRVSERGRSLVLSVCGAVPESTFAVKGVPMSPIASHELRWEGEDLVVALELSPSAQAFQVFREQYPLAVTLVVSSRLVREGYDLQPLAGVYESFWPAAAVVLDPAHGGEDWGAVGDGIREKDITLEICKRAASIVEGRLGVEVYLTRDSDYRVPPQGRAELSNSRRADLFVSVHCDSWFAAGKRGFGVAVLPAPVTEGRPWRPGGRPGPNPVLEADPAFVIRPWDTVQARHAAGSRALATAIVTEMAIVHDGPSLGVQEVDILGLKGIDAPAVAVQCGFVSNEKDRKLLASEASRDRIAAAIARGIELYLEER